MPWFHRNMQICQAQTIPRLPKPLRTTSCRLTHPNCTNKSHKSKVGDNLPWLILVWEKSTCLTTRVPTKVDKSIDPSGKLWDDHQMTTGTSPKRPSLVLQRLGFLVSMRNWMFEPNAGLIVWLVSFFAYCHFHSFSYPSYLGWSISFGQQDLSISFR